MITISIDCGASFIKTALIINGSIKDVKRLQTNYKKGAEIFYTHDIEKLVDLIESEISRYCNYLCMVDCDNSQIINVAIANEMHGFILACKDATPFTKYISWQDEYGAIIIDNISSTKLLKEQINNLEIEKTGMPLRSGLPSNNLLYLRRANYLSNANNKLYFYTLGDYIIRRITGSEPYMHVTNAAATGLYNLENNCWNRSLCNYVAGEFQIQFPTVGTNPIKYLYKNKTLMFYPAIGDQQAALLGAGMNEVNELSFNLGTGAQVSVLCKKMDFSPDYQIRPYFDGYYLKVIPHIPCGRAINVYVNFIKDILTKYHCEINNDDIWQTILENISIDTISDLKCDLSFFENAITKENTGSIFNITENNLTFENLFTSVLNQMANNYLLCAKKICNKSDIKKLIFSGGIAKKISYIQDRIMLEYAQCDYYIAENETLLGLYKYSLKHKHSYGE